MQAKKAKLAFDEIKKKSDDASRHSANHKAETDNLIAEKNRLNYNPKMPLKH